MTKRSQTITALRTREFFYLIFFLFISDQAWGQYSSTNGNFQVNVLKGCTPLEVEVINTSGISSDDVPIVYKFAWDGKLDNITLDPLQDDDTTYYNPGTYKILQVIGGSVGTETELDSITIEVMEPLAPQFKAYSCINNAVYVDFSEEDYYDALIVNYGDGEFDTLSTSENDHVIYSYTTPDSYIISVEGIFDGALQSCYVIDTLVTTFDGDEFARMDIDLVRVDGTQSFEIAYDELLPGIPYQLEVSENGSNNFEVVADLPGASSVFYLDNPDFDTRENFYCFRVVAVNQCDPEENIPSNTVCSIALQAAPEDLQNRITWQSEGFGEYQVSRDGNQITSLSATEYVDTDVQCQEEYTYNIIAEANGASSISAMETITAISTSISPAPQNLAADLQSTGAVLNWPEVDGATTYYIYRSEDGGANQLYDSLQVTQSSTLNYTDPQELVVDVRYCYQLTYRDACGNESELSEEACVLLPQQASVVFPNAFTPNGDGLNDTFVYKANLLQSVRFQVYNRWGELIFSTEEIGEGWDGNYQGQMAPQGTYLYVLEVVDELGNTFSRSGNFTLFPSTP